MGPKESITVQWNHFTRQFTVDITFLLRIELEDLNCVPFDVFYHFNAKFCIFKETDFLGWVPSHASSLLIEQLSQLKLLHLISF